MKAVGKTDVGIKRTMNQDYMYCGNEPVGSFRNLYIVADGMGGHKAGDHASKLCVEKVADSIKNSDFSTPVSLFKEAVAAANSAIYKEAVTNEKYAGMGTTMVACTIQNETLYVANIGDSRLYLIRDDIKQITVDHSLVEEMVKQGNLTESEARIHPQKNIITRAMGIEADITADYFEIGMLPGDVILMCSDGLSNMMEDEDIEYIVKHRKELDDCADLLIRRANENGGSDNITVILIEY